MNALSQFLKNHSIPSGDKSKPSTHTRIGDKEFNIYGGNYHIPDSDMKEFNKLYYDEVIVKGTKEYLTERQLADNGTFVVDLDFRYNHEISSRQHTSETIQNILCDYASELNKYFQFKNGDGFEVYVMEKPNVNRLADGSLTKDGIHLMFNLSVPYDIQRKIRENIIALASDSADLPLINGWDSVFDDGITKGTTNWNLYGSRKPNNEAYEITQSFNFVYDKGSFEFHDFIFDKKDFHKISVRNKNPAFQLSKEGEKAINKPKETQFKPISSSPSPTGVADMCKDEVKDKYVELLNIIGSSKTKIEHNTWYSIGRICKTNNINIEVFKTFTKTFVKNKIDDVEDFWNKWFNKPLSIYNLQYFSKIANPDEYVIWLNKHNVYVINDLSVVGDFQKMAEYITPTLKKTVVFCKEEWYVLNELNLWRKQKDPAYYITKELKKYLNYTILKYRFDISKLDDDAEEGIMLKKKLKILAEHEIRSSTNSDINNYKSQLRTLLLDNKFADKLDCNVGELAFKNGIMDLETGIFRDMIFSDDLITETIPYNYNKPNEQKMEELKKEFKKIMNNNDEHLNYCLSVIGQSFIAMPHKEKSLYYCVDKTDNSRGDNGKTFMFDILTHLMPNYVYKTKSSFLEADNSKAHKQLAMMKGKRLVWIDELGKKEPNSELLKECANGLTTENEIMFGTSESINILFKLFILTNNLPKIDPKDTAVYNRYKQLSYNSHFDRTGSRTEEDPENLLFIADCSLGDKIKEEYYNEVFGLIIYYAKKYYVDKFKLPVIPLQFINDTKATQASNDEFGTWFEENCDKKVGAKIALKELIYKSGFNDKMVKEGMSRKCFKYLKDLSGMGKDALGKSYKGGFEGICLKDIIEEIE